MARNRVQNPVGITTWEQADEVLRGIVARQREVARIELDLNERIAALKQNAKLATKEHQAAITAGEKQLALFAELHKEDFGKAKSRVLTHGVIGWRKSSAVKLLRSVAETVAALLRQGHEDCVQQPAPKVDKVKVRQELTDTELAEAGIQLDSGDTFFWEAKEENVADLADADAGAFGA